MTSTASATMSSLRPDSRTERFLSATVRDAPARDAPARDAPARDAPARDARAGTALTTCLWFDSEAEEAAAFYTRIFKDSRIGRISRFSGAGPGRDGEAMTVEFELNGQRFVALNGLPHIYFNEAISFQVFCDDQTELDYYWNSLSEDGKAGRCGWLQDRYGLSWQVIPRQLVEMIGDPDLERSRRTIDAMLRMTKLDIAALQHAYAGE